MILLSESLLHLLTPVSNSASGIKPKYKPTLSSAVARSTPISSRSLSVHFSAILLNTEAQEAATSPHSCVCSNSSIISSRRSGLSRAIRCFRQSFSSLSGFRRSLPATKVSCLEGGAVDSDGEVGNELEVVRLVVSSDILLILRSCSTGF